MNEVKFENVLPSLATAYRRGELVPFIGSGMSQPKHSDWNSFVNTLCSSVNLPLPAGSNSIEIYRRVDAAARRMRGMTRAARSCVIMAALTGARASAQPVQTRALARLRWPLVVSTNYEDCYWQACAEENRPSVVGRSLYDCHQVLYGLDAPATPLLWAIQGYVGAGLPSTPSTRDVELFDQVVMGYQEYQRTMHGEPHFRRALAEVFHRRSVFFLGSGLAEDYFINLIGEIQLVQGPGARPHYALVHRDSVPSRIDPEFLQSRLGIVPVVYGEHQDVCDHLDNLADEIQRPFAKARKTSPPPKAARATRFDLQVPAVDSRELRVVVQHAQLGRPTTATTAVVVSLGRDEANRPLEGVMATSLRKALNLQFDDWQSQACPGPSYTFRCGRTWLWGCAARRKDDSATSYDNRDLAVIPEALAVTLGKIAECDYEKITIGPIASGRHAQAPWEPVYPFIQAMMGLRRFTRGSPRSVRTLDIRVVDWRLWALLEAGHVPLAELLSGNVSRYRIDVVDRDGRRDEHGVTVADEESATISTLASLCGVAKGTWAVALRPKPHMAWLASEDVKDFVVPPFIQVKFEAQDKPILSPYIEIS